MDHKISRRKFIKNFLTAGAAIPFFMNSFSSLSFANNFIANNNTNKRLVFVFLRGGLDSLSTVIPYADPHYKKTRQQLALKEQDESLIAIDNFFAFHKNMKNLANFYIKKELAVIHAVATPYRSRSHFDAQDLLESGTNSLNKTRTGWLNRAIESIGGKNLTLGLSLGPSIQLVMRGNAKVTSWSPSILQQADTDILQRLAMMYKTDSLLENALLTATENDDIVKSISTQGGRGNILFKNMMEAAANFLSTEKGPRIATIDFEGFDTHTRQNTRLSQLLKGLDDGIQAYRDNTDDNIWKDTIIYVVSEFGRTAKPNGSNGTDHGTAGLAMVIGGNIEGGRIITKWPGLSENQLYQGRDLNPTIDLRSISKNILTSHYNISPNIIDRYILPNSLNLTPMEII